MYRKRNGRILHVPNMTTIKKKSTRGLLTLEIRVIRIHIYRLSNYWFFLAPPRAALQTVAAVCTCTANNARVLGEYEIDNDGRLSSYVCILIV